MCVCTLEYRPLIKRNPRDSAGGRSRSVICRGDNNKSPTNYDRFVRDRDHEFRDSDVDV